MDTPNLRNRLHNSGNPYQGSYKKVLCVCSAGLLRSPTAAYVLSQEPFNFNTRACGIVPDYALIPLDRVLLGWADEIVCMDSTQEETLKAMLSPKAKIINLNIPDRYGYRDAELVSLIVDRYNEANG